MDRKLKQHHERINSLAPLLLNTDNEFLKSIADDVFADYEVVMKFIWQATPLSDDIAVSGRYLCWRRDKFGPVIFDDGVELLEGTPTRTGGSNKYPRPCFKEDYCILKFQCSGLPIIDGSWKTEVIKLTKI